MKTTTNNDKTEQQTSLRIFLAGVGDKFFHFNSEANTYPINVTMDSPKQTNVATSEIL
jgi:hypothetical protein